MKRILNILLVCIIMIFSAVSLVACGESEDKIYVYMPDGAPALAMSKLMYENVQLKGETQYTVVPASNIGNYIINKTADVAVIPVNMASKLLGNGENYKIVATVTNGNLYLVGNENISSLTDLKGQVVGVIGQGNVPDLNFKYLLSSAETPIDYEINDNVIDGKVAIRYFAEASNLLPMLKQNKLKFGLLPEPAVSKLLSMADNFNIELDIQELWEGGCYPQAVVVVKTELCNDTQFIDELLSEMTDGESWVLSNTIDAVNSVNSHLLEGSVASLQTTISRSAIENCNIKVKVTNADEILRIKNYLSAIKSVVSNAVGNYGDNMFCEL